MCPTNLDPAYDKPPDENYICVVCKQRGVHFKSICPKNADPHSINQKRKARGIKTPTRMGRRDNDPQPRDDDRHKKGDRLEDRDHDRGRLSRAPESPVYSREDSPSYPGNDITPSKTSRTLEKLQEIEDMKVRLFSEAPVESAEMTGILGTNAIEGSVEGSGKHVEQESASAASGRSSNETSPHSKAVTSRNKRLRKENENVDESPHGRMLEGSGSGTSPCGQEGPLVSGTSGSPNQPSQDYEIDIEMTDNSSPVEEKNNKHGLENNSPHTPTPVSRKLSFHPHRLLLDLVTTSESKSAMGDLMDFDDLIPPAPEVKPTKQYSKFVLSLMQGRSEMSQVANPGRQRPTALDMWNQDDQKRRQRLNSK